MPKLSGGGIQSNKYVTSKSGGKVEPIPHKASPAGAAQLGRAVNYAKEPLQQGRGYSQGPQRETGVAQAKYNSATTGPGSLRTTYRSGSQAPTPPAEPMPPGRNTLAEYGPEISGPSRRR
jgi:hypothetical protein